MNPGTEFDIIRGNRWTVIRTSPDKVTRLDGSLEGIGSYNFLEVGSVTELDIDEVTILLIAEISIYK